MAEKKYFKLSERTLKNGTVKKIITIDDSIKPTKQELEDNGAIFTTTSDTEVICHIIVKERLKAKSAEEAGFSMANLGPRILRCETAPDYCLSAISYRFEL